MAYAWNTPTFELIPEDKRYQPGTHRRRRKATKGVRIAVFVRDNFTCQICGWEAKKPEGEYRGTYVHDLDLGHLIPYRDGGPYHVDNLQAECHSCNLRKRCG